MALRAVRTLGVERVGAKNVNRALGFVGDCAEPIAEVRGDTATGIHYWERSELVALDHPFLGDRRLEQALVFSLCGCVQRFGARDPELGEAIAAFRADAAGWR